MSSGAPDGRRSLHIRTIMPTKPALLGGRPKSERRREQDGERRRAHPWRNWYSLAAWKQRRAAQLADEPLCRRCVRDDRITAATTVNHVIPHRGNWQLFIAGALESLCKPHHDSEVQAEERQAAKLRAAAPSDREPHC
jgi:5-methylcytosine-specific restriction enzyme A